MSPATQKPWYADIPRSARAPTLFGVVVLGVSVLGFGVWGGTAPIAGAVVASGMFVATGQNKIIQHLEGGVIREIAVREGDRPISRWSISTRPRRARNCAGFSFVTCG
jgi:hypothetical protein